MANERVALAMSGGVDSSVAAVLLIEQGYEVIGLHLKLYQGHGTQQRSKSCCSLDEALDARLVCERLGIPFYVLDFQTEFQQNVIDYFIEEYEQGKTPNPCVMCNRTIKSELLLAKAEELGCDRLATGHYARLLSNPTTGEIELHRPRDLRKDQTYFLHGVPLQELKRLLFPLQDYIKAKVRLKAQQLHLASAEKPDSQEICFIDNNYREFLSEHMKSPRQPGSFVNRKGEVLGQHQGIAFYTVGQRRGLGISDATPWYVIDLEPARNEVVLGKSDELEVQEVTVNQINWLCPPPSHAREVFVQLRYTHKGCTAQLEPLNSQRARLVLPQAERAVAPGQAAVFYEGTRVLGGGWIEREASRDSQQALLA